MSNTLENPLVGSVAATDALLRALYRQMVRVVGGMEPYALPEKVSAARKALTVFGACKTPYGVESNIKVFHAAVRAFERLFNSVMACDSSSPTPTLDFVQRIAAETGTSDIAIHNLLAYAVTTPLSGPTVDALAAQELLECATCGKTLYSVAYSTATGCVFCDGVTPRYSIGCSNITLSEVSEGYRFLLDTGIGVPPTPYEGSLACHKPHWSGMYVTMARVFRYLGQLVSHNTRETTGLALRLFGACNVNCNAPEYDQMYARIRVMDCVDASFSAFLDEVRAYALSSRQFSDAVYEMAIRCGVEPGELLSVYRQANCTSELLDSVWEGVYDVIDHIVCARCSSYAQPQLHTWLENGGCADCKMRMVVCPHCGRHTLCEERDDLNDLAVCCWMPITWCGKCGGHATPKEGTTLQVYRWPEDVLARPSSSNVVASKVREETLIEMVRRRCVADCWGKESLSFGVEVECGLRDTCKLEQLGWDVKDDASLRGMSDPVELTAGPFLYREFDRFMEYSERWLRYGTINRKCGMHLHVGRLESRFSWFEVYRLMVYHKMFENWFYATQPEYRRESRWCEPMVVPAKVHTKREFLRTLYGDDDTVKASCGSKYPPHNSWLGVRRWFNVQSWMCHGTIEIRLHAGTCSVGKIVAWKELFAHTFEHALKVSPWKWRAPWQILPKPVLNKMERRIESFGDVYHARVVDHGVDTFFGAGKIRRVL